jgi:hypothetical protein
MATHTIPSWEVYIIGGLGISNIIIGVFQIITSNQSGNYYDKMNCLQPTSPLASSCGSDPKNDILHGMTNLDNSIKVYSIIILLTGLILLGLAFHMLFKKNK